MSSEEQSPTALVVDDDATARRMLTFALENEGFTCHCAGDGDEATRLLASTDYQVVVTDLRMPHKHGHTLAMELLGLENRPIIAVHTSLVDPKITKDLLYRGVDDIIFKPTDYAACAAKLKMLAMRKFWPRSMASAGLASENSHGRVILSSGGDTATDTGAACISGSASQPMELAAHEGSLAVELEAITNRAIALGRPDECDPRANPDQAWVANTGERYHRQGCRFCDASGTRIDLQAVLSAGMEPCKVCKPLLAPL